MAVIAMFASAQRASRCLTVVLTAWFALLSAGIHAFHTDGDSPGRCTLRAARAANCLSLGADGHRTVFPDACPACRYLANAQSDTGFLRGEAPVQPVWQPLFLTVHEHLQCFELLASAPPRGPPCLVLA